MLLNSDWCKCIEPHISLGWCFEPFRCSMINQKIMIGGKNKFFACPHLCPFLVQVFYPWVNCHLEWSRPDICDKQHLCKIFLTFGITISMFLLKFIAYLLPHKAKEDKILLNPTKLSICSSENCNPSYTVNVHLLAAHSILCGKI